MYAYGTIPASMPEKSKAEYISRAKERLRLGLGTRRPWREFLDLRSFGVPTSFHDAISRSRAVVTYFRMNYAIVALLILFLSLLWRPISLIVLIAVMAAWLFFYFLRDEPLLLFGRVVDDRVVLIVLSILTVVFLVLTRATVNVLAAVAVGAAVVLVHAAFRKTEDLFLDNEEAVTAAAATETDSLLSGRATLLDGAEPPPPPSPPPPPHS